jgi:hypothetical protein
LILPGRAAALPRQPVDDPAIGTQFNQLGLWSRSRLLMANPLAKAQKPQPGPLIPDLIVNPDQ